MNFKRRIYYLRNEVNRKIAKMACSFSFATFLTLALSLSCLTLKAESSNQNVQLQDVFSKSETKIISLNNENLSTKTTQLNKHIDLGEYGSYKLSLEQTYMFSGEYLAVGAKKNNVYMKTPLTFKGTIQGKPSTLVSLTTCEDYLSGFIDTGEEVIYFEPYKNFNSNAKKNELIIYYEKDVIDQGHTCAVNHIALKAKQITPSNQQFKSATEESCKEFEAVCNELEVEIVIVADYGMYLKHGSETQVHITSVLDRVRANYNDEFEVPITFNDVDWLIIEDPEFLKDISDASTLLSEFSKPGVVSNITNKSYDLASLWVARDISHLGDINTTGIASTGGMCRTRYNVIEDHSSDIASLSKTFAHEIGHNFGATHVPEGIMREFSGTSNEWSQDSKNQINAFYQKASCLCAPGDAADLAIGLCGSYRLNENILSISGVEVHNLGPISTGNDVKTHWYLSADNIIDISDHPIKTETATSPYKLNSFSNHDFDVDLSNMSIPPGNYYLIVFTDYEDVVPEYSEENNIRIMSSYADISIAATPPDLQATCSNLGISIVSPDVPVTAQYYVIDVENRGTTTSGQSTLGLYLSCDDMVTTEDFQILTETIPALSGGGSHEVSILFDRSTTYIPAGNYTLGFIVDANEEITESNESNNVSCKNEITIEQNPTIFGDGVGDVNLDGVINILDAFNVSQYAVRAKKIGNCRDLNTGDNLCLTNGDITGDCIINILDAYRIAKCAVGVEDSCP